MEVGTEGDFGGLCDEEVGAANVEGRLSESVVLPERRGWREYSRWRIFFITLGMFGMEFPCALASLCFSWLLTGWV